MPAIAAYIPVVIVVSIATSAGLVAYQLRATVESVEEIITGEESAFKSIAFQLFASAFAIWLITKSIGK